MIDVILVDDEQKAIDSLSWELENFSDEVNIVRTFTQPEEALTFLQHNPIDCVFLDIEMPTMDGFQFLNSLTEKNFAVIITTAYNEYAIKAIKQQAIDYLLKPVDIDDLTAAVEKIKLHINQIEQLPLKIESLLKNYDKDKDFLCLKSERFRDRLYKLFHVND